jgi:outer membrane lipoprotein carrier protein
MAAALFICISMLSGSFASTPEAADPSPGLRILESRYASAHTLQATFLERYFDGGRVVRVEAGTAYFLRPGKMRWDYQAPEKTTFLVDGKFVWFYSPADRTATRMPAKKSEDWRTPLAFLTSGMKLSRICSSVVPERDERSADAPNLLYSCLLRSSPEESTDSASRGSQQHVLFEITPSGELVRISFQRQAGIVIEFTFKNWQWNPSLPAALFHFEPPPGVAIVNGLLPETSTVRQ